MICRMDGKTANMAVTLGAQLKKVSIDADVIMGAVNELGFSR